MDFSFDFNVDVALQNLFQLGIAYVMALPIALNREQRSRPNPGLRTFPLVAIASCGYMLLGMQVLTNTDSESRVLVGLITGIGFIGGGAILKKNSGVHGTATAACLWLTGAIGAAVAFKRYEISLLLTLIAFLTMQFVPSIKDEINGEEGDE